MENTVKRWSITTSVDSDNDDDNNNSSNSNSNRNKVIRLIGEFITDSYDIRCVVDKDDNTLITASGDCTLTEWNITTCETLRSLIVEGVVWCMVRAKRSSVIVCGLGNGWIQLRSSSDLALISTFKMHWGDGIYCCCELGNGSFVTGGEWDKTLKRWSSDDGTVLMNFTTSNSDSIWTVAELNSDIIVSVDMSSTIILWNISTGDRLHTLTLHSDTVCSLVKLSTNKFVSGSNDKTIRVWDYKGNCIETIQTEDAIGAIARSGDDFITFHERGIAIRRLK